jgi:signal transduction histidine kinase
MSGWWDSHSLRLRLMSIGLVGIALVQAVSSVALYTALSVTSRHDLDRRAAATAQQVAALVVAHRLPDPIPVTGTESVQVLDADGRVISASASGDRLTALLTPAELARAESEPFAVSGSRLGMASPLRVSALRVSGAAGAPVVVVAEPVADLTRSQHILVVSLLLGFPLLLLVLGLVAWRVIGATLRPVESLRSAAERVSGAGDDERLPEPRSRDEIWALAVTLNSMLDRLAAARDRERTFVANVAHELRNPLASLRVQADVNRRHGASEADHADLAAELARLSALVEDLLVLARLDAGDALPPPDPAAEPGVVLPGFADADDDTSGPEVRVGSLAAGTVPMTRLELERVVGNLVDNARRHARARVDIAFSRTARETVLSVADDGAGIPAADRARVFDRFARLDEARDRDSGGTGLGLAIVRELVRRRGGDVRLGASSSGGLLAEVRFPDQPVAGDSRPGLGDPDRVEEPGQLLDALEEAGARTRPGGVGVHRHHRDTGGEDAAGHQVVGQLLASGAVEAAGRHHEHVGLRREDRLPRHPPRLLPRRGQHRLTTGRLDHLRDPVPGRERGLGPLQEHHPGPRAAVAPTSYDVEAGALLGDQFLGLGLVARRTA